MKNTGTNLITALLLLITSSGCNETYVGEGPVIEQNREVGAIKRVALNMNAKVFVRDTSVSYCIVKAQEGVFDAIVTRMDGGTLVIGTKGEIETSEPIEVEVGMVRPAAIEVNGSGSVTAQNILKNDNFEFEVNGSGKLTVEVVSLRVKSYVSGSGVVDLRGSTQHHRVEISGSGMVNAEEFTTLTTGADISGSGRAKVAAAEKLDAQVTGSGLVIYTGDPKVNQRITGSGKVRKAQ